MYNKNFIFEPCLLSFLVIQSLDCDSRITGILLIVLVTSHVGMQTYCKRTGMGADTAMQAYLAAI